jgi:hypothetical protein
MAMSEVATDDKTCLHLVVAAGGRALEDCLARSLRGDTILFLDAGVLHLLDARTTCGGESGPALLFAAADLEAHGLLACARAAGVHIAGDADFGGLLAAHGHCLTWT